jgi:hypothetical protein
MAEECCQRGQTVGRPGDTGERSDRIGKETLEEEIRAIHGLGVMKWGITELLQCLLESTYRVIDSEGEELVVKGKAIPLQAWRGPERSRRLRLPDFKTIRT